MKEKWKEIERKQNKWCKGNHSTPPVGRAQTVPEQKMGKLPMWALLSDIIQYRTSLWPLQLICPANLLICPLLTSSKPGHSGGLDAEQALVNRS